MRFFLSDEKVLPGVGVRGFLHDEKAFAEGLCSFFSSYEKLLPGVVGGVSVGDIEGCRAKPCNSRLNHRENAWGVSRTV